jgi:alpha-mannosidase
VGGVEVNGGTIYTTLLRAPKGEYAGMVADATSSQHGTHDFSFEIAPYAGSWSEAGVIQAAQELNNPLLTSLRAGSSDTSPPATSFLSVTQATVVLSGVKSASDGSGDIIVRVYETAGKAAQTRLAVPGVIRARTCDLRENSDSEMSVSDGALSITLTPFQIQTLRLSRDDGQKAARNQ